MEACSSNFKTVSVGNLDAEHENSPDGIKRVNQSDRFKSHMADLRRQFSEVNKNREYSENRNEYSQNDMLSLDKGSVFINEEDSKHLYSDFRNKDSGNPMIVMNDVNNDAEKLPESMALLDLNRNADYLKDESSFDEPKQNDVLKKKMEPKIFSGYEMSSKSPELFSTVSKPCHQRKSSVQFQTGDNDNKFVKKNYRHRNNRRSFESPQYSARDSDDKFKTVDYRTTGGREYSSKCSPTSHHHQFVKKNYRHHNNRRSFESPQYSARDSDDKYKTVDYRTTGGREYSSECSPTSHHHHQSKKFTHGCSKHGHKMESQSSKHHNHKEHLSAAEKNVIEILNAARTFKPVEPKPLNYFDGAGVNCFKRADNNSSDDDDDKPKNTPPPGGFVAVKPYTSADLAASQPNIIWSELWELEEEWKW